MQDPNSAAADMSKVAAAPFPLAVNQHGSVIEYGPVLVVVGDTAYAIIYDSHRQLRIKSRLKLDEENLEEQD